MPEVQGKSRLILMITFSQEPIDAAGSARSLDMQASSPGALAGREKEGELATTSLEFEYLHRKSRCPMLIGGDDISNDVITLGSCFPAMFIYIRARFRFALIGGKLTAQSTGNHREVGGGIQIPETYSCKLFFLFPLRRQSARRARSQATGATISQKSPWCD